MSLAAEGLQPSKPAGGTWDAPVAISRPSPPPGSGSISDLQVEVVPGGEALAIWSGFDGTERVVEVVVRSAS